MDFFFAICHTAKVMLVFSTIFSTLLTILSMEEKWSYYNYIIFHSAAYDSCCRGKSLIVVFLASSMNSSKSLFNAHTCRSCQKLMLPLVPLIFFKVFAAPCLSHSLRGAVFLKVLRCRLQSCKRA